MKISKIEIKDFHQFKDLTIDLTYPKGHAKEGQPLDKVCFIGQSGTGKTTLLELIPKFLFNYDSQIVMKSGQLSICDQINISINFGYENDKHLSIIFNKREITVGTFDSENNLPRLLSVAKEFNIGRDTLVSFLKEKGFEISGSPSAKLTIAMYNALQNEFGDGDNAKKISSEVKLPPNESNVKIRSYVRLFADDDKNTTYGDLEKWITESSTKLIYFPANLNYDIEIGIENTLIDKAIIDFSREKVSLVWNLILEEIQRYQEQELQIRQEISRTVEQSSNNLETIQKALKKLEEWKINEFNPIQDIADNCLNILLEPFKLRVKAELDIKSKDDIGFIKVEDFNGNEIPHGLWSTGTKQVILSAMPLYLLKPKHTVILFDEPERSLYPDMQRLIIDYYSSLTDNCQFFYSTHSPIIASNFEPWEIVELKFNGEGKVYRELYYEGDNHINNYKWNPKYMRWDDILQRVFDMENDGSPERKKKLDELARNNVKYKKVKEKDSNEAKDILENISRLSKELSHWD